MSKPSAADMRPVKICSKCSEEYSNEIRDHNGEILCVCPKCVKAQVKVVGAAAMRPCTKEKIH